MYGFNGLMYGYHGLLVPNLPNIGFEIILSKIYVHY